MAALLWMSPSTPVWCAEGATFKMKLHTTFAAHRLWTFPQAVLLVRCLQLAADWLWAYLVGGWLEADLFTQQWNYSSDCFTFSSALSLVSLVGQISSFSGSCLLVSGALLFLIANCLNSRSQRGCDLLLAFTLSSRPWFILPNFCGMNHCSPKANTVEFGPKPVALLRGTRSFKSWSLVGGPLLMEPWP